MIGVCSLCYNETFVTALEIGTHATSPPRELSTLKCHLKSYK